MATNVNIDSANSICDGILENLNKKVEALYHFKYNYFEHHDIKESLNKERDVELELSKVIAIFDEYKDCIDDVDRATYFYLRGKALNVGLTYNKDAEAYLSKSLKLNPKLMEAWNEMGECYWKNENLKEARNCYNKSLQLKKNNVALRSLSMLTRQYTLDDPKERLKNIELGLNYAKEALQLDPSDGCSWSNLACAHLSSFFGAHQSPKTLKLCMSAFLQAEKDPQTKTIPEFHYNKGVVLQYQEEFRLALESYHQSCLYGPSWENPVAKKKQLVKYLDDINEMVKTSGKMKLKRLHQLLQSLDSKQLGPFFGGSYKSSMGEVAKLDEITFSRLKSGCNEEKVILGKVVCSVRNEQIVPFTFCMVDTEGKCVAVTLYNLAEGQGVIIGDSIAIPEPYVTDVEFEYGEKEYKFRLIRVQTPVVMVVNGKKLAKDKEAGVQMKVTKKTE